MLVKHFMQASSNLALINRVLIIVIVALTVISFLNYRQAKNYISEARTILVTPNMTVKDSQYIITSDSASEEYIRATVRYAIGLYLNYSPASVGGQFEELIFLYSPTTYEEERVALMDLRDRVRESARITSSYIMDNMVYFPEEKYVVVKGMRTKFSKEGNTNRMLESGDQKYKLEYEIKDGHFKILRIRTER